MNVEENCSAHPNGSVGPFPVAQCHSRPNPHHAQHPVGKLYWDSTVCSSVRVPVCSSIRPPSSTQVQTAVMLAWSAKTSEIVQQRRHKQQTEEELAARRCSAATLIQAVWRSYSTRKVCAIRTKRVKYQNVELALSSDRKHRQRDPILLPLDRASPMLIQIGRGSTAS